MVAAVGVAEADHTACVGKERRAGTVGVPGEDRVKVVGELGAEDTLSIVVGVEKLGIAAATAAEEVQRAASMRCTCLAQWVVVG